MNEQTVDITGRIEEMLNVLARDKQHIEYAVSKLNDLRGFVIKRDEQGLVQLLGEIREETMDYQANEDRRGVIQKELAGLFGCQPRELTLSVLKKRVSGTAGAAIGESQEKLRKMVNTRKTEMDDVANILIARLAQFHSTLSPEQKNKLVEYVKDKEKRHGRCPFSR